ncbi:MAG: DUF2383 domain-containing protein [Gammaproteobacteria bacterium]
MDNQHVISTINELIETCKDGELGFRTCAEHVDDSEIKAMFTDRARHCAESASWGTAKRSPSLGRTTGYAR